MQNQKMPESLIVPWIRWTARVLSWVWAPWALFWTLFVLGHLVGSGSIFGIAGFTFAVVVFPPLSLGAAFVASVWKNERVGGKMLLFDGVLMLALTAWVFDPHSAWVAITGFWTMVVPPLVAGALFLSCHRMSDSQQLHPTKRAGESGSPAVHR
ncbi:MAG: DUF7670 domain-containing protein [Planctomycetota bacterium]